jgi:hypothetical protein
MAMLGAFLIALYFKIFSNSLFFEAVGAVVLLVGLSAGFIGMVIHFYLMFRKFIARK